MMKTFLYVLDKQTERVCLSAEINMELIFLLILIGVPKIKLTQIV